MLGAGPAKTRGEGQRGCVCGKGGGSSWDGELDHQVFFSVHFDLRDGAVGVGRDLWHLKKRTHTSSVTLWGHNYTSGFPTGLLFPTQDLLIVPAAIQGSAPPPGVLCQAAALVLSYLLDVRVRHQVAGQHLVGLAGQRGQGGRLFLGEAVAQHGQFGAAGERETRKSRLKKLY